MSLYQLLQQCVSKQTISNEVELRRHLKKKEYINYKEEIFSLIEHKESVPSKSCESKIYYFNDNARVIQLNGQREYQTKFVNHKTTFKNYSLFFSIETDINQDCSSYDTTINNHFVSTRDLIESKQYIIESISDPSISKSMLLEFEYEKLFFKNNCMLINRPFNQIPAASVILKLPHNKQVTSIKFLKKIILDFKNFTVELCSYSLKKKTFYSLEFELKDFTEKTAEKVESILDYFN